VSAPRPSSPLGRLTRRDAVVRGSLAASVALGLLATSGVVAQALAVGEIVSRVGADAHAGLASGVVLFGAGTLARALGLGLAEPVAARLAAPARRRLRRDLVTRALGTAPSAGADAFARLASRGVDAVEAYLASYLPSLVLAVLAPTALLGWLAWREPLSAGVVALCVALLPVFMVLLGLEAREKMARRWRDQQRLAARFGDVVRGMTVLKANGRSSDAVARLDQVGEELGVATMDTLKVAFLSGFALELLSSLATALVAMLLGLRLLAGRLSLATALAVLIVTPEVFWPLRRAAARFHASASGVAAAAEVLDDLAGAAPGAGAAPRSAPEIVLEGVVVASVHGETTVSARIRAGSHVEVTGPSGSGKTSLLRLIGGLDAPRGGRILVDGRDRSEVDPVAWGAAIAWVPQDPALPGATVREALANGRTLADAELTRALDAVGLDLDLARPLGEGGATLSAGQRRRVAVARALAGGARLLLLDEPTAHLDDVATAQVAAALDGLAATVLVATHHPTLRGERLDLAREVSGG
jgi:ABC-type transport system involved in cytochrome bd biosynthesis fused ATPase/permease subunit